MFKFLHLFPGRGKNSARVFFALALVIIGAFSLWGIRAASAEGSRNLNTGGGKRALTEWRINTTAGLYRRTFFRVYAVAGENILMGSSAMGVGSGDIVLYRENQISSSQIAPAALALITPEFKCSTGGTGGGRGRLTTRAQELAGPQPASGGYVPCTYTVPATGTYWVAMYGPDGVNGSADGDAGTIDSPNVTTAQRSGVSMWDITVRNAANTVTISGRVFVDYLAQITGGNGTSRRIYSTIYSVTNDGFIYKVEFRGLDPNGFIFYGNRVGFLDPDGKTPLYHDMVFTENTLSTALGNTKLSPAAAKMFFSYPAADLPANILPTPTQPSITNISYRGSASGAQGYFSIGGEFTYTGNIGGINQIIISRDGVNFDPANPNNRVLYGQSVVGVNTIAWDGKDNSGVAFPVANDYPFQMSFRAGEYHFPMLDVENSRLGGPTITLMNPIGGTCPLLTCRHAFYDDRGYRVSTGATVGTVGTVLPGNTPPATAFSNPSTGFDTSTAQRAFGNDSSSGFGDWKGLDLWTYFPIAPINGTLDVIPQVGQDLRIVKSHTIAFNIGESGGTFSLLVSNSGTSTVSGQVTVTDALPASLTYRSASGTNWSCSALGQDVTCIHTNDGGLAAGASLPVITLIVDVGNAAAPSVANTASVANANDTVSTNNQFTDIATVNSADIQVTKTVSNNNPSEGDAISFTIVAANLGPSDASSVEVTDLLPPGLTYVSASATQGSYTPGTGVWVVGGLPNATSATLTIHATVDLLTAGSDITNTATRTASSPYDYNSANDAASATVNVKPTVLTGIITDAVTGTPLAGATVTVVDANNNTYIVVTGADGSYTVSGLAAGSASVSAEKTGYATDSITTDVISGRANIQDLELNNADLVLFKSDGQTTTTNGATLVYTIIIQNTGGLAAENLTIYDTLSLGLSYNDNSCLPTPCLVSGQDVIWTLTESLAPGDSITLTLSALVTASSGSVSNYAYVTTTTPESDLTDNENSDIDAILSAPDLKVTITDGQTQVLAGQPLTYNLTYANIGNADATTNIVTVQVPEGLTDITPSDGGVYDPGTRTITWDSTTTPALATLVPGASGALSFTAQVDPAVNPATVLAATAAITDDGTHGTDQDLSNNTASDSDITIRPDLVLSKTVSGPARLDSPVLVTLSYSNPSAAEAQNVVVNDSLPGGTSYVEASCAGGTSCSESGGTVTWIIGTVPPGGSGTLTFQMDLSDTAGGGSTSTPTYAPQSGGGSLVITSTVGAASLRGLWNDTDPVGPAGWQANPVAGAFGAAWSATVASYFESYWLTPTALTAEWVAVNASGQIDPNYTFFRQSVCLPLNAAGLTASLNLAGDDVSDIYLNGAFLGNQVGGGGSTHFNGSGAAQPGPNLLAVRLLNNRHGGHAVYGGLDHVGLLYNLSLEWSSYQPFAQANTVILAGQMVSFSANPQALVGQGALNYRFEFGEGTPQDYSTTATATYTYNNPGVYTAVVRARDGAGCTAADTLTITVLPSDANLVANTASASYTNAYSVAPYTTSSGTAFDLPLVDLTLTKSSSPNPGTVGEDLTYTLTVSNNGPRTLTSLTLIDGLPSALLSPVYTPSAGSYDPLTGAWTEISLASGGSLTLEITGLIDPLFDGTLDNTASVSSGQASETDMSDNTASDSNTPARLADLGIGVTGVQNDQVITYTITIVNNGSTGMTSFFFSDVLPTQMLAGTAVYLPGVGSYDPDTNEWSGVTFLTGDILVMTVVGRLPPNYPGVTLDYLVTVTTPSGITDAVSSNNNASVTLNTSPTAVILSSFTATGQPGVSGWVSVLVVGLLIGVALALRFVMGRRRLPR